MVSLNTQSKYTRMHNGECLVLKNNKSNKTKKQNKASASKSKKNQPEGSSNSGTGVPLDKVADVIATDVTKTNSVYGHFEIGESFQYKKKGSTTTKSKTGSTKTIDPMPKDKVVSVLQGIYEKNYDILTKKGLSPKNARKVAGSTVDEFRSNLNLIVPDEFTPKNPDGKRLKKAGKEGWKTEAIRKEGMLRKLKQFMADGSILIYRIDGKFHFQPTTTMGLSVEQFRHSIFHIMQIRNVLFAKRVVNGKVIRQTQWNGDGYRTWFKEDTPLGLSLDEFENVLSNPEEKIWDAWKTTGFDKKALGILAQS